MKKILKSPVVIIISLILGCIIGIYFKKIVPYLKDINSVYISLLSMSATPLVICSIIINIEKVFKNKNILKMLGLFSALLMLLVGIFSFCSIYFFKDVLKPDDSSMLVINKMISTNIVDEFENIAVYDDNSYIINKNQSNALKQFLFNIVPDNVFTALATGSGMTTAMSCLEEAPKLGIDKNLIESIIPVTTFLCSIGVLIQTVIVSVYAIIIYNVSINFNLVIIVILGAILFSISTVGTSSQTAVTMLGIVLDAFSLLLDVVGVIYILVGTFCSRFKTFCKLYPNLAVVAVLDRIYKSKS